MALQFLAVTSCITPHGKIFQEPPSSPSLPRFTLPRSTQLQAWSNFTLSTMAIKSPKLPVLLHLSPTKFCRTSSPNNNTLTIFLLFTPQLTTATGSSARTSNKTVLSCKKLKNFAHFDIAIIFYFVFKGLSIISIMLESLTTSCPLLLRRKSRYF